MYDLSADTLDGLRAGPEVFAGLLSNCSPEQAHNARGGDEGWSIVEVMCHLRDAEERALERTVSMRDMDDPFLPGYDQEQWARERDYASANLRDALDAFSHFRSRHVDALAALAPDAWQRTGRHEEQGQISIEAQARHMAAHDAIHAAQIARQLRARP